MENHVGKEATTRDFLKIIYKRKLILIATIVTLISVVFINLELKTPMYEASVKLMILGRKTTEAEHYSQLATGLLSLMTQEANILTSTRVIERVVEYLKLYEIPLDYERNFATGIKRVIIDHRVKKMKDMVEEMQPEDRKAFLFKNAVYRLKSRISVIPAEQTVVLIVSVSDYNPAVAAAIANSLSRSYMIFDLEQIEEEISLKYGEKYPLVQQLKSYIKEIEKTLDGKPIPSLKAFGQASAKIIEQADVSSAILKGASKTPSIMAALAVGLVLGILFAFGFEYLDYTIRSPQDIEKYLNISFLGSIPKRKSKDKLLISDVNPSTTDYTQSFGALSEHLHLLMKNKNFKSLLIADAEGSNETAAVIANFGIYLSHEAGQKVLIIDANLRYPSVSKVFDITNNVGLTDVLENKAPLEDAVQDLGSGLHVLTAGQSILSPITFFNSSAMSELIKKAKEQYELIFINCADIKRFSDAVILSSFVDCFSLVINEGKVRRQVVKNAITLLEEKKVNIIGAILNNRIHILPGIIYKIT